jgi:hypothetical protein
MKYRFVYTVEGTPAVENVNTGEVFAIYLLKHGEWEPLESEDEYFRILGIVAGRT